MGPEGAAVTGMSLVACGCIAYTFYQVLTPPLDIVKILIGAALSVGAVILLIHEIKKMFNN